MRKKGYKHTEKTKQKISKSKKGKSFAKEHKEKLSKAHIGMKKPWAGKAPKSKEWRIKRSKNMSKENHWNWKGGITEIHYIIRNCFKYRQWRSDVFTRDNFVCQECGVRGIYLEAHHIKMVSEIIREYNLKTREQILSCQELWNINNGITLCKKCHNKTKGKYLIENKLIKS